MTKEELKTYLDRGIEKSKELFKKGSEVSRDALDKAGKAAQKFGDESVLKIEIKQLESQIKKDKASIGEYVYKSFSEEKKDSVTKDDDELKFLLEKIQQAEEEIKAKKEQLEQSKS